MIPEIVQKIMDSKSLEEVSKLMEEALTKKYGVGEYSIIYHAFTTRRTDIRLNAIEKKLEELTNLES